MTNDPNRESGTLWDRINLDSLEDAGTPAGQPDTDAYTPSTDRHGPATQVGTPKTGRFVGDFSVDEDDDDPAPVQPKAHTDTYAPGVAAPVPVDERGRPRTQRYAGDGARMRTDVFQKYVSGADEDDEEELTDAPFMSPAWDIDDETREPDIDRPATDMFYHEKESSRHDRSTQEAPAKLIQDIRQAFEIGGAKGAWRKYLELGGSFNPWVLPEEMLIGFIRLHYTRKDWDSLRPILEQMVNAYPEDADQARLLQVVDRLENRDDTAGAIAALEKMNRSDLAQEAHRIQYDRLIIRAKSKQSEANPSWLD